MRVFNPKHDGEQWEMVKECKHCFHYRLQNYDANAAL